MHVHPASAVPCLGKGLPPRCIPARGFAPLRVAHSPQDISDRVMVESGMTGRDGIARVWIAVQAGKPMTAQGNTGARPSRERGLRFRMARPTA